MMRCTGIRPGDSLRRAREAGEKLAAELKPKFERIDRVRKALKERYPIEEACKILNSKPLEELEKMLGIEENHDKESTT